MHIRSAALHRSLQNPLKKFHDGKDIKGEAGTKDKSGAKKNVLTGELGEMKTDNILMMKPGIFSEHES